MVQGNALQLAFGKQHRSKHNASIETIPTCAPNRWNSMPAAGVSSIIPRPSHLPFVSRRRPVTGESWSVRPISAGDINSCTGRAAESPGHGSSPCDRAGPRSIGTARNGAVKWAGPLHRDRKKRRGEMGQVWPQQLFKSERLHRLSGRIITHRYWPLRIIRH